MAITTIIPDLLLMRSIDDNPNSARIEDRKVLASDGVTLVKRRVAVFPDNVDGLTNPELVYQFMLPSQYPSTTGFQLRLCLGTEGGVITGNVVFEIAAELILDTGSSTKLYNANNWGTVATGTITVPGVAYELKMATIDLAKTDFGGDTSAAGTTAQLCRIRIRRLTSSASDTLVGNILVFAAQLAETG